MGTALVDTTASLWGYGSGVIAASEVHELLTKIQYILDYAASKMDCDMICVLTCFFHSASRQCHEVWASQFPFLHRIKDFVSSIEACLYAFMDPLTGP